MILGVIIAILLLGVFVGFLSARLPLSVRAFIVPLPALIAFILTASAGATLIGGESVAMNYAWIPALSVDLALTLHGMGLLLALLVTGIGTLVQLYATGYMGKHDQAHRLYGYLYAFMLAMVGLSFADHMLLIFVFWELTSITSYLLIGFNHAQEESRKNALQALLVTGLGGMALLCGFILLATVSGTWFLTELVAHREVILASSLYPAILILVVLGAFTKSAQFPFHFWLPNAMAAPTPVSAYLHSATMVKAGIFLLAVMLPVIGGTYAWTIVLTVSGGITLWLGGFFGLREHDLKKVLAGTTISVLGLLTLLLGVGTEKAVLAALVFMLGHALYKATLFMVAGSIDHETGTRDSRILGGLRSLMPWTAGAALLACISKMGLPPFFGFIGKEYTYKATLAADWEWLITACLVGGNAMLFALAIKAGVMPFFAKPKGEMPKHAHEAPWSMRIGPLLLAAFGLLIGILPALVDPMLGAAKSTLLGKPSEVKLYLWQGVNLPLILSGVTVASGLLLVKLLKPLAAFFNAVRVPDAEDAYAFLLAQTISFAKWQTRFLQSGLLRNYLLIILGTTLSLIVWKLSRFGGIPAVSVPDVSSPVLLIVVLLMILAVYFAIMAKTRLAALTSLGLVGYGVALIYALFSAPDLAITQILVETLTVVLFAWVVYKLPAGSRFSSKGKYWFDGIISVGTGLLVTILVLKSQTVNLNPPISNQLAEWSYVKAYGANVVNVILVDFRALDTMGEIAVLAIAALGVWALLKRTDKQSDSEKGASNE